MNLDCLCDDMKGSDRGEPREKLPTTAKLFVAEPGYFNWYMPMYELISSLKNVSVGCQ